MAERLYVGTRKGLFELARRNGGWDIVDVHFLGDPVTAVLADGDNRCTPRSISAISAPSCGGANGPAAWRELPAPAFPPKPEDAADDPHPVVARHDLGDRAGRRARPAVDRHDAGRAVPLRRWRRHLVAERDAVAHARAAAMDGRRRRRAARHQLGAGRSARPRRHPRRRVDRRRVGEPRRRRLVADHQSRHVQRIHAAGAARDADRAGHPPPGALRRPPGHRVVPAP